MRKDILLYGLGVPAYIKNAENPEDFLIKKDGSELYDREIKQGATGRNADSGTSSLAKQSNPQKETTTTVKEDVVYIRDNNSGTVYEMTGQEYKELQEEIVKQIEEQKQQQQQKSGDKKDEEGEEDWVAPYMGDDDETTGTGKKRRGATTDESGINSNWLRLAATGLLLLIVATDEDKK